jgi:hypothetical protein
MHPWMVHGLSPNCGSRPRMALTARIHARGGGAPRGGVVKGGGLGAASTAGDARESPRSSVPRDPGPASEAGG